jgi:GNAT superfamily N-acetyltransferase
MMAGVLTSAAIMSDSPAALHIRPATPSDVLLILDFIRELADYERLLHEVTATDADLHAALFGADRVAYATIASVGEEPAGFALYFFSFSTFLAKPGLYLEDLYVRPAFRRRGIGRALLAHLAQIAVARDCGRMEWAVLNWNEQALSVYRAIGALPQTTWTTHRLTGEDLKNLAAAAPAAAP